ncbi:glycosyltransferase family 4 protein [Nocardia rosealba]|uniref:glycosyltransferase family 4 protein n=1 Tax=Nocardia rosealba TaxID=2878563 RepID=UPI001CD9E984|nr:glycosyltransferase family 4 protein [Nocardia rosealba]MCA2207191.1 glycosyltransferase family 4 protein [Nocardia rosealba]
MPGADRDLLFVAHSAQASGAEKVMLDLIEVAVARGYRVRVACPVGALSLRLPGSVGHVAIPELGLSGQQGGARFAAALVMLWHWVLAAAALRKASRGGRARLVVNSTMALPAVAMSVPRRRDTVWLVHDILASTRQFAVARIGRLALARAVAVSERAAAPVRALGIETEVAWLGVPWPVEPAPVVVRSHPVVGILGVITEWKGHHVLLEAVAALPEVSVEIAGKALPGDEPYLARLRDRAAQPDLAGRVHFLGHVDPLPTIRGWDVLVSASVLPEAGPLVVLEAMSVGVPVVATDHGGNVSTDVAVCVRPDDPHALREALSRITADHALRARLREAGLAKIATRHNRTRTRPHMFDRVVGDGNRAMSTPPGNSTSAAPGSP